MSEKVKKEEVEDLLGCEITDEQFQEALEYAERKQAYIYWKEYRAVKNGENSGLAELPDYLEDKSVFDAKA